MLESAFLLLAMAVFSTEKHHVAGCVNGKTEFMAVQTDMAQRSNLITLQNSTYSNYTL